MRIKVFLNFTLVFLIFMAQHGVLHSAQFANNKPIFDGLASIPYEESTLPGFIITPEASRYWPLGAGESALAIKALRLALDGKHKQAQEIKSELDDPTARTLIDWLWVHGRKDSPNLAFLLHFVRANPDWPRNHRVHATIERSLLAGDANHHAVRAYFKDRAPLTPAGMVVLARASKEAGKTDEALALIRKAYHSVSLRQSLASKIVQEFGDILTDHDRLLRLDGLIVHHETTQAVRVASGMDKGFQLYAKAAHKLLTQAKDAPAALKKVPFRIRNQPGLQYTRVRYQLRKKKPEEAAKILLKANATGNALPYPERWWKIRRDLIQDDLSSKKRRFEAEFVYRLAAAHGLTEGKFLTDAEWNAGWIAYTYLDRPAEAAKHFHTSAKTALRTHDKARGHYWLAKSLEKLGETDEARLNHQTAAGFGYTFYGLLSEGDAGGFLNGEVLPPSAEPTHAERLAVGQSDLVRAVQMLAHESARKEIKVFMKSMAHTFKTPGEHGVLIELAEEIGGTYLAMKFARYGEWRSIHVGKAAFPLNPLPNFRPLTKNQVESPLILSVARQESEFNDKAVSPVGARGLMQIMPATARWLCGLHKVKCSPNRLTADPAFNVQLGSAFLYRLVREYKGSYIMAAAAYNAGGARVQKWNATVGDPRKGEISAVDWIELIPFSETKNYVKRVMRNVQIYRRQIQPDADITLTQDIQRGSKTVKKADLQQ
jgi:soluble lytic murein transglycosylase